jgi:hypothetical protein
MDPFRNCTPAAYFAAGAPGRTSAVLFSETKP